MDFNKPESIPKSATNIIESLKDDIEQSELGFEGQKQQKVVQASILKEDHKKKKRWLIFKETFIEFSQRTDINAYGKIFEYENYFVKLLWLIVLLGSLGITAWILSWSVLAYLQYGVVSQIGVVYENPTEFPAVTFCDNNPFTTEYSNFIDGIDQAGYPMNGNIPYNFRPTILGKMTASNPSYGDEKRKLLGLTKSQIFLTGSQGDVFPYCFYNNQDCSDDLHWHWHYDYGNCFQFNVGLNSRDLPIALKKSNMEGAEAGFQIFVIPLTNNRQPGYRLNPSGMVVFVHNASLRPLKSDQVFIEPGKNTQISVKRTFVSNVNSPYTKCQDLTFYSSELYNFIINSTKFSKYRQKDCFNLCIQALIIANCSCSYSGFDNPFNKSLYSTVRPCLTLFDYDCYNNVFKEFDPTECATNSCPLECEYFEYDLSVSSLVDPSREFYKDTVQNFCFWSLVNTGSTSLCPDQSDIYLNFTRCRRQNAWFGGPSCEPPPEPSFEGYDTYKNYIVKFSVFYPSLSYNQIQTSPAMSLPNLIANLSGSLGLIVSVSVFTLFEIVELVALILHGLFFKNDNKIRDSK